MVDAMAAMVVVVPARRAAVRGLAHVVAPDPAPGRDHAALRAVVPSRAAAPSPRMDPNRQPSSPVLVLRNAPLSQSPVHRSGMTPARDRVPSQSVARAADPSPRITSPAPVPRGTRTHVRAPGHEIVLIRRTSETSLARLRPKTMTTRPIETTIAMKIRLAVVLLIGKI